MYTKFISKKTKNMSSDAELLRVAFKSIEEDKQLVFGEVYAPNMVDTDWEAMTPEDVEFAAHEFMKNGYINNIDVNHDLNPSGAKVVESFIIRNPEDPFFKDGSWVLGVWVPEDIWVDIKAGKLNGFSFYGTSVKQPVSVVVDVIRSLVGETESGQDTAKSIDSHKHTFVLRLDEYGKVVSGHTDFKHNHQHIIKYTTATETAMEHAHRFFVE